MGLIRMDCGLVRRRRVIDRLSHCLPGARKKSHVRTRKAAASEPGRRVSPETELAGALALDSRPPEVGED